MKLKKLHEAKEDFEDVWGSGDIDPAIAEIAAKVRLLFKDLPGIRYADILSTPTQYGGEFEFFVEGRDETRSGYNSLGYWWLTFAIEGQEDYEFVSVVRVDVDDRTSRDHLGEFRKDSPSVVDDIVKLAMQSRQGVA